MRDFWNSTLRQADDGKGGGTDDKKGAGDGKADGGSKSGADGGDAGKVKAAGEGAKAGEGKGDKQPLGKTGLFDAGGKKGASAADGGGKAGEGGDKGGDGKGGKDDGTGVPAKFRDAEGKLNEAAFAKAYRDLETANGKLRRDKGMADDVPDDAADYFKEGFELDAEVDRLAIEGPDDPGLKVWGKVAHKFKIGKADAIAIAKEMFRELNPLAPEPINREAELKALGPNAANVVDGVHTWLVGLDNAGKFREGHLDIIRHLSATADGISFLALMRGETGEKPLPLASADGVRMSADDWHAQYSKAMRAKDYVKQGQLEEMRDRLWPDGIPQRGVPDTVSQAEKAREAKRA